MLEGNIYDNGKYLGNTQNPYRVLLNAVSDTITSCEIHPDTKIIASSAFSGCKSLTAVVIPNGVYYIGSSAFSHCGELTSVSIPDSVKSIGDDAFYACHSLQFSIYDNGKYLGNAENPYMVLHNAASQTIPSCEIHPDTKIIGESAFYSCSKMTSLTIPDGVVRIAPAAFNKCSGLTKITIPNSVISIGSSAFINCTSLTTVELPNGITAINADTFYNCRRLASVTIPDSVKTIGESAFSGCSVLKTVIIPEGIPAISDSTFRSCSGLTSVTIPFSVKSIGRYAFSGCSDLKDIYYGGTQYEWTALSVSDNNYFLEQATVHAHEHTFQDGFCTGCGVMGGACGAEDASVYWSLRSYGVLNVYGTGAMLQTTAEAYPWYSHLDSVKQVVVESGVTSIGDHAFANAKNLTSATLQAGVATVGSGAFSGCEKLRTLILEAGVQTIGSNAFDGCASLPSVTIPYSMSAISNSAFAGCTSLASVTIEKGLESIGEYAFDGCSSLTDVYFLEKEEFWKQIAIGQNNAPLTEAEIHFHEHDFGWGTCSGCNAKGGTCGKSDSGVFWILMPNGGLTVYGEGTMDFYHPTNYGQRAPWYDYLDQIKQVVVEDGIKNVAQEAFSGCVNLRSVQLADSVTNIGYQAFKNCTNLSSVSWGDDVAYLGHYAFSGCTSLTQILLPENLTALDYTVFENSAIQYLIHNQGKYLGSATNPYLCFVGVSDKSITSLTIADTTKILMQGCVSGCENLTSLTIPDGVTAIAPHAFYSCDSLTDVVIGNGVTVIDTYAFAECSNLTNLTIGSNVKTIKDSAFQACTSLTTVTIPDSVTFIETAAFWYCINLTSVHVGKGVTGMNGAFTVCLNLEEIWVDEENPNYSSDAQGVLYNKDKTVLIKVPEATTGIYTVAEGVQTIGMAFYYCTGLTEVIIGKDVTTIENGAFYECNALKSMVIPDHVTSVGGTLFYRCYDLESVTLPQNMTSIPYSMFIECTSLTSVTIPEGVTLIDGYAFADCTSLTSVNIPEGVTKIGNYAFRNCSNLKEICYGGSAAQWANVTIGSGNDALSVVSFAKMTIVQPQDTVVKYGADAVFTVQADATNLTYQWQYSLNGGKSWFNSTAATQGYNTSQLTVVGKQNRDGFLYRCRITDSKGEVCYTDAATLSVDTSAMPKFTAQPASQTVTAGGKTQFTASFTGEYSRVYWQYSIDGGRSWYASSFVGCDTDTLTVECKDFRDGFMYRCVLIDACGNRTVSSAATLAVQ